MILLRSNLSETPAGSVGGSLVKKLKAISVCKLVILARQTSWSQMAAALGKAFETASSRTRANTVRRHCYHDGIKIRLASGNFQYPLRCFHTASCLARRRIFTQSAATIQALHSCCLPGCRGRRGHSAIV